jgi:hypothetical protein
MYLEYSKRFRLGHRVFSELPLADIEHGDLSRRTRNRSCHAQAEWQRDWYGGHRREPVAFVM